MATVFSTATLGLRVDATQFNKDIGASESTVVKALAAMSRSADAFDDRWKDLTYGIKDTKRIISGILISQGFYALMNGITAATGAAIDFSSSMETAAVSLEYFVDAAADTKAAATQVKAYLREVNDFAARTPFSTADVLSLSKYMQAVGVAMSQTQSVLSVITDTAAATGANAEQLQRITFALGQMLTKGRIANEEIRQLANANIPIYEILKEELNLTGEQISNIGNYWIDASDAVVAILNGLDKRYNGAADKIAETLAGLTDTILDDAKIIADEAFGGIYDKIVGGAHTIRDLMDHWRSIVTAKGLPGLFNDVALEIDPTGQLGNQILQLVGNLKNLNEEFIALYQAAGPVLSVIGKSLYVSTNIGLIALTSLCDVAEDVLEAFDKMGISSTALAKGLASLFIAYKATKLISLLGEGLSAAAIAAYNAGSGILSLLPASLSANAGIVTLTASVASLIAYLATAASLFGVFNSFSSGLSAETGSNGLSESWNSAYADYEKQLKAVNDQIEAQRVNFTEDYSEMSDGYAGISTDKKNNKSNNKSSGGGSSEADWVAAFDEVYDVPDENATGAYQAAVLDDFSDLLDLLGGIKFPQIDFGFGIDEPKLGEVFGADLFDESTPNFLKRFLPIAILAGAAQLGNIFSKAAKKTGKVAAEAAEKVKRAIEMSGDELKAELLRDTVKVQSQIDEVKHVLNQLRDPRTDKELRSALEGKLAQLTKAAHETQGRIDEIADAMALAGGKRPVTSPVLRAADATLSSLKITRMAEELESINAAVLSAADSATKLSLLADQQKLRKTVVEALSEHSKAYGEDKILSAIVNSVTPLSADDELARVLSQLQSTELDKATRAMLEDKLTELVKTAHATQTKFTEFANAQEVPKAARTGTITNLEAAEAYLSEAKIRRLLNDLEETLKVSTDASAGVLGSTVRTGLDKLRRELSTAVVAHTGAYGTNDALVKAVTRSIESSYLEDLSYASKRLAALLTEHVEELDAFSGEISQIKRLVTKAEQGLAGGSISSEALHPLLTQIATLSEAVSKGADVAAAHKQNELLRLGLDNRQALNALGQAYNGRAKTATEVLIEKNKQLIAANEGLVDAVKASLPVINQDTREAVYTLQQLLNENAKLVHRVNGLEPAISKIIGRLSYLEANGAHMIRLVDGTSGFFRELLYDIDKLQGKVADLPSASLVSELLDDVKLISTSNSSAAGIVEKYAKRLVATFDDLAAGVEATPASLKAIVAAQEKALSAGYSNPQLTKRIEAAQRGITPRTISQEPLMQQITKLADDAVDEALARNVKNVQTVTDSFNAAFDTFAEEYAAKNGLNSAQAWKQLEDAYDAAIGNIEIAFTDAAIELPKITDKLATVADFTQAIATKGLTLRTGFAMDQLGAGLARKDGQDVTAVPGILRGALFKADSARLSAAKITALVDGLDKYGKTYAAVLAGMLDTNSEYGARILEIIGGIAEPIRSVTAAYATELGTVGEDLLTRLTADARAKQGYIGVATDKYVSPDRIINVQIDAAHYDKNGNFIGTDDTKLLSKKSYEKLREVFEQYGELSADGREYVIRSKEGLKALQAASEEYYYQLALHQLVTGKPGSLSVFSSEAIQQHTPDLTRVVATDQKQLQALARTAIVRTIDDSEAFASLAASHFMGRVQFDKASLAEVHSIAELLNERLIAIQNEVLSGEDLEQVALRYFVPRLNTGTVVENPQRYLTKAFSFSNYKASHEILSQVTSLVSTAIEPALKNPSAQVTIRGLAKLDLLIDALERDVERAQRLKKADNIAYQIPSFKGGYIEQVGTLETGKQTLQALRNYREVMGSYGGTLVTQFDSYIRQLNSYAARGITDLSTVINEATGKTLGELLDQAIRLEKSLRSYYGTKSTATISQLFSYSTTGLGHIVNPYTYANLVTLPSLPKEVTRPTEALIAEARKLFPIVKEAQEQLISSVPRIVSDATKAAEVLTKTTAQTAETAAKVLAESSEAASTARAAVEAVTEAATKVAADTAAATATKTTERVIEIVTASDILSGLTPRAIDTDASIKLLRELVLADDAEYTFLADMFAGTDYGLTSTVTGKRLAKLLDGSSESFVGTTIYDALGNILYRPAYTGTVDEALVTKFFDAVVGLTPLTAEAGTNGFKADGLEMAADLTERLFELGKTDALSKAFEKSLVGALEELDLSDDATKAVKGLFDDAAATFVDAAKRTDADSVNEVFISVAKQYQEKLADSIGSEKAAKFADTFSETITSVAQKSLKTLQATYSDELAKSLDAAFSITGSLGDESIELLTSGINKVYGNIAEVYVAELNKAVGGTIDAKAAYKIIEDLNERLLTDFGDGVKLMTITADEIPEAMRKAVATALPRKFTKKYGDEVVDAINATIKTSSDEVAKILDEVAGGLQAKGLGMSDEAAEILEAGIKRATENAASQAAEAVAEASGRTLLSKLGEFIPGTSVGVLDIAALGLSFNQAHKESEGVRDSLERALEAAAQLDKNAASGLEKLSGNTDALLSGTGLANASYKSAWADVGFTLGGAGAGGLASLAGVASGPAGWIAAGVGLLAQLGYGLGGGNDFSNKYTDNYIKTRDEDLIYKNALSMGLTEAEARAISDQYLGALRHLLFADFDTQLFKGDDMNRFLYGSGDGYTKAKEYLIGSADVNAESAEYNRILRLAQAFGDKDVYMVDWKSGAAPIKYSTVGASTSERRTTWQQMIAEANPNGGYMISPYQTDNTIGLKELMDYIYKEGGYYTDVGAQFRATYSSKEEQDYIASYYGRYMDALSAMPEVLKFLNMSQGTNLTITDVTESPALLQQLEEYAIALADAYSTQQLSLVDAYVAERAEARDIAGNGSILNSSLGYMTSADLSSVTSAMLADLARSGLVLTAGSYEYGTDETGPLSQAYTKLSTDPAALTESLRGALFDFSDKFNYEALNLTADDVSMLAKAGIMINSDGTVQAMFAGAEKTSGAERTTTLDAESVSSKIIEALAGYSISINFDSQSLDFGDFSGVTDKMTSALFRLPDRLEGELSENMRKALNTIGTITEDGLLKITNKAILGGTQSMTAALNGLDWSAVSDEVKAQLYSIAALIDKEGASVQENIIEWAAGVVVPSPISVDDLTGEIVQDFNAIGISFQMGMDGLTATQQQAYADLGVSLVDGSSELQMIISNTGEALANGTQMLDKEDWLKLVGSEEMPTAVGELLASLGVTWQECGSLELVNIAGMMSAGADAVVAAFVEKPETWALLPESLKEAFGNVILETDGGMLAIMQSMDTGMLQIGDAWVVAWEDLDADTQAALDTLGLTADHGVATFKGYIDGQDVPANVDKNLLVPFEELPDAIKEQLRMTDENCGQKLYDLNTTITTETQSITGTFANLMSQLGTDAGSASDDIVTAMSNAMLAVQNLIQLQSQVSKSGFLGIGSKNNLINYNAKKIGSTNYYEEYTKAGKTVKYWYTDSSGAWRTLTTAEAKKIGLTVRASGGPAEGTTLAGELGTEMAILPDGSTQLVDAGLYDFPRGTQILNAEDTATVRKYAGNRPTLKKFAEGSTELVTEEESIASQNANEYFKRLLEDVLHTNVELLAISIKNAATTVAEELGPSGANAAERLSLCISNQTDELKSAISDATSSISSSLSSMRASMQTTAYNTERTAEDTKRTVSDIDTATLLLTNWAAEAEKYAAAGKWDEVIDALEHRDEKITYIGTDYGSESKALLQGLTSKYGHDTIKANAGGGLVTGESLVHVGEFGKTEAILPLEQPGVMAKLGLAMANAAGTGSTHLTVETLVPVLQDTFSTSDELLVIAIKNAATTLSEDMMRSDKQLVATIADNFTLIQTRLTENTEQVKSAISLAAASIDNVVYALQSSFSTLSTHVSSTDSDDSDDLDDLDVDRSQYGGSAFDQALMTTAELAAAATIREAAEKGDISWSDAHAYVESIRDKHGYSGGGNGNMYITGSASGSLVDEDALYRAGELGLKEAIIPLERPNIMRYVGSTIASYMPTDARMLSGALGMSNAGVTIPHAPTAYLPDINSMVDRIAQSVLESVLPAMASISTSEEKTPIYVGTLIADDRGIKQLERKLYVIRQAEEARR